MERAHHKDGDMRRREDTKVEQLGSIALFRHCDRRDLQRVARIAAEVTVAPGEVLCRQGDVGRHCYVILDGELGVLVGDRVVATVGPGESVGEMSLLDRRHRSATVVAVTAVRAYSIPCRQFTALIADAPSVALGVMRVMSHRIRAMDVGPAIELTTA